ncbi:MAG: hypothetical protein IJD75_04095 [Clostridia bacterium]|nr:hypothetical protein [Clostridia bacterium]
MPNHVTVFLLAGGSSFWEQIAGWYQNSTLGELISYFRETYFSIRFGAYDNFSVTEQTANIVNKIIPALIIGIIIAAIATVYCRHVVGQFVRTLIEKEALSPESGVTLFDTGAFRSTVVRRELCRGAFFKKVVRCREEEAFIAEKGSDTSYQIDFTRDHFYIPEELKDRAEIRFNPKGSSWLTVVLTAVLTPIVVGLICRFLPNILQFADSIITYFAP